MADPPGRRARAAGAGYSGTPLPRKLGIKEGMKIALAGAPAGFETVLRPLPAGVRLKRRAAGRPDVVIWFVKRRAELRRIERVAGVAGEGSLWIAWRKQSSGMASDVSPSDVRRGALAIGLVDSKVCAIDDTWSGLRFTRRRSR